MSCSATAIAGFQLQPSVLLMQRRGTYTSYAQPFLPAQAQGRARVHLLCALPASYTNGIVCRGLRQLVWPEGGCTPPTSLCASGVCIYGFAAALLSLHHCVCSQGSGNSNWWENGGNTNLFMCPSNYVGECIGCIACALVIGMHLTQP